VTFTVVLLIPALVLAIVGLFVFAGCTLVAPLDEHHAAGESYPHMILHEPNLLSYWRLGETHPAGPTATDSDPTLPQPGSYNGNVTSAPGVLTLAHDTTDTCVAFDGSSEYVEVPYHLLVNPPGAFSVEAWIKPAFVAAKASVIVGSYERQPDRGYRLRVHRVSQQPPTVRAEIRIADATKGFQMATADFDLSDPTNDGWHHIVATYNPPDVALYLDGHPVGTATVANYAPVQAGTPLRIGAGRDESTPPVPGAPPDFFFSGRIDEVALYARALDDVPHHFAVGTGK
jgi:Concanavalin A-like lectin/glucanases superfamily